MANLSNINNKFLVTTGGNVGINSTSPIQKLDTPNIVIGGSTIAGTFRANALFIDNNGGNSRFYSSGANGSTKGSYEFNIMASDANPLETPLVINSSGNVGIGTNSPTAKLHVLTGSSGATVYSGYNDMVIEGSNGASLSFLTPDANPVDINFGTPSSQFAAGIRAGYNSGTEFIAFKVADSEKMRIIDTGNVGIGTTAPTSKLHVNGSGATHGEYLRISNGTTQIYELQPSIYNVTNNGFGIYDVTDSTYRLVIDTNGNVGIGTTGPDSKLDVKGASATPADGNQTLSITNSTGGTQLNIGTVENSYGWIEAREGATLRSLLLNPNGGNVGIGTTSPAEKLEVSGSVKIGNLKIQNADGGRIGFNRNTATGAIYDSNYAAFQINGAYSGADYLEIQNYASTGGFLGSVVLKNGNFGIGTTSPSTKLDVAGTLRIAESGNTAFYGGDYVRLFGAQAFRFLNSGGSAIAQVSLTGNSYFNGGNVGIGTTGPNAKLKVEGNATTNGLSIKSAGNGGTYPFMVTWSGGNEGDVFCINNALNVGIGTLNPSKKLSVNGGIVAGNNNTDAGASQIYGDIRRPQATNFSKRNYVLTAGSSGALYSIARQWHDTANWGLGNINVIMWGIYYGRTNFSKADFSCRYGYSGNVADIEVNFNPGGLAVPGWTAATQVSGNIYYRDLQIQIPAYMQISFEIISPGLVQTYNVNNTAHNTVYLYPH